MKEIIMGEKSKTPKQLCDFDEVKRIYDQVLDKVVPKPDVA